MVKSGPWHASIKAPKSGFLQHQGMSRPTFPPLMKGGGGGVPGLKISAIWACTDAGRNPTPANPPFVRGGTVRSRMWRKSEFLQPEILIIPASPSGNQERPFCWRRFVVFCFAVITTGCGGVSTPPSAPPTASPKYGRTEAENAVILVLATQLGKNAGEIDPSRSLKDLGADELDLVEAVMELEEKLDITIADEALDKASGYSKVEDLVSGLTVEKFAAVVSEARRAASAAPRPRSSPGPAGERAKAKQPVPVSSLAPGGSS